MRVRRFSCAVTVFLALHNYKSVGTPDVLVFKYVLSINTALNTMRTRSTHTHT